MSIEALLNIARREAQKVMSTRSQAKKGIVTGYDATNYCAKVELQPEGTETGWLPIGAEWVGNGWGLFAPPSIGDMVEVNFDEGDRQSGYVGKKFYSDADRPLPCPSGEFWLVHVSGSALKLTNDGKLLLNSTAEIDAGDLGSALHKMVTDAFVSLFNGHTHPPGSGGNTGAPNQQMTNSHLTSIFRAN